MIMGLIDMELLVINIDPSIFIFIVYKNGPSIINTSSDTSPILCFYKTILKNFNPYYRHLSDKKNYYSFEFRVLKCLNPYIIKNCFRLKNKNLYHHMTL